MLAVPYSSLVRTEIKNSLMEFIYKAADAKIERQLKQIALMNERADVCGVTAFFYKGSLYCPKDVSINGRPRMLNRIFNDQMQNFIADKKNLDAEKIVIENYITCLLMASAHTEDIFCLFPDVLHPALKGLGLSERGILSLNQIQDIKEIHKDSVVLIKKRLILNLIS